MIQDLRHIRAFLAAARHGNFTRAAMEMHISQSAFTVQIRQLEDALGVSLFDRSKRRVALTSAGRELLQPLERLIVDAESIVGKTRQLAGLRRGIVNVAALPTVAARLLPDAIKRFAEAYPGIVVQLSDMAGEKIIEAVKKEEVDFGIGSRIRVDREIRTTLLFADRLCAFIPGDHLLARRETAALKDLAAFPLIVTGKDSSVRELLEKSLKREKTSFKVAFETNYMTTAIGMVRAGLGIAILPESAATLENPGQMRCVLIARPTLSRKIEIIQRKDRSLSPAAQKLAEILTGMAGRGT
jgi:LysR family carnitine catabolism transcriptional activator